MLESGLAFVFKPAYEPARLQECCRAGFFAQRDSNAEVRLKPDILEDRLRILRGGKMAALFMNTQPVLYAAGEKDAIAAVQRIRI